MIYSAKDEQGRDISYQTAICVGDIIKVHDYGCVYSTFPKAYQLVWGENGKICDFYNLRPSNDKLWKVHGIVSHFNIHHGGILVGIQDREFNKLIVGIEGVRLFRKKKVDTNESIKVKRVERD